MRAGRTGTGPAYLLLALLTAAVVAAAALPDPVRSWIVFAAAIVVPGAVIVRPLGIVPAAHRPANLGLAIVVSLGVETAVGLAMAWTGFWHPDLAGAILAAGAYGLLGYELHSTAPPPPGLLSADGLVPTGLPSSSATGVQRRRAQFVATGVLVLALVLWATSLSSIHLYRLGSYGLPPALDIGWYAALFLLLMGATYVTWTRSCNGWLIVAYTAAIALVLFATIPILSSVPEYAWSYKHIGVTSFIQVHGSTKPSADIYQRWPGYFSLAAWLSTLTGIKVLAFARWNGLFMTLVDMLLVAGLASRVSTDRRVWNIATLTFLVTNWVGQTYYSPQSFAYALNLAILLILFRRSPAGNVKPGAVFRAIKRITRGRIVADGVQPLTRWTAGTAALVILLDAVMVATHQLTPYLLVAQLAALAVLGILRPRWILLIAAVIPVAYLLPNLHFILTRYGLLTGLNPLDNVQVTAGLAQHRALLASNVGGVLSVIAGFFALAAFVRLMYLRRDSSLTLTVAALLVSPFALLFGSNYGGEASLRVFLFSSPWRDILIASALVTLKPRLRVLVTGFGVCLLTTLFLYAAFDTSATDVYPKGEVTASAYFYAHAPRGSELMLAQKDFPTWMGVRYLDMDGELGDATPNLLDAPAFKYHLPGPEDLPKIEYILRTASPHSFLVFSTTEQLYSRDFGPGTEAQLDTLERAVATSPAFRLWYGNRDARIYELVQK